jgi:hypothetical protein
LRGKKNAGGDRESGLLDLGAALVEKLKQIGAPS